MKYNTLLSCLSLLLINHTSISQCQPQDGSDNLITDANFPTNTNLLSNSSVESFQIEIGGGQDLLSIDCWDFILNPDMGTIGEVIPVTFDESCDTIESSYDGSANNNHFICFSGPAESIQQSFPFSLKKGLYRMTYHYASCDETNETDTGITIGYSDHTLIQDEAIDYFFNGNSLEGAYFVEDNSINPVGPQWYSHTTEFSICEEDINNVFFSFTGNSYRHLDGMSLELIKEFGTISQEAISDVSCPYMTDGGYEFTFTNDGIYSLVDDMNNVLHQDLIIAAGMPNSVEGLSAGTYTLTITDTEVNCSVSVEFTIGTENDFCCTNPNAEDTIIGGGSVYWTSDATFHGNIIVEAGSELNITNCTIKFAPNVYVEVQPGAQLIVSDAVLTSKDACEFWSGIQLVGNKYEPQTPEFQSYCVITNSEVSHAKHAIVNHKPIEGGTFELNSSGGYGTFTNVVFKDNTNDIWFRSYFDSANSANQTEFTSCDFVLTADYSSLSEVYPRDRVTLDGCPGISFYGCEFENQDPALLDHPTLSQKLVGLNSKRSEFRVECDGTDNPRFLNFAYGIRAYGWMPEWPHVLKDAKFECYRGAFFDYNRLTEVTNCEFQPLPAGFNDPVITSQGENPEFYDTDISYYTGNYGLYNNDIRLFICESNTFSMGYENAATGLLVKDGLYLNNTVRGNVFEGNVTGCKFFGQNRNSDGSEGLFYSCNDYFDNEQDVEINGSAGIYQGVARTQGSYESSASNQFNVYTSVDDNEEIINYTVPSHSYYYYNGEVVSVEIEGVLPLQADFYLECESIASSCISDGISEEAIEVIKGDLIVKFSQARATRDNIVDGGNTIELTEEIINSDFTEALELYYDLMSKSPNLSIEVMVKAIEQEFDLPMILLKQILTSNPQAGKSQAIEEHLDQRLIPLPEYMREQIKEGMEWVSQKEELEARMSQLKATYQMLETHQKLRIWADDSIIAKRIELEELAQNSHFPASTYEKFLKATSASSFADRKSDLVELMSRLDNDNVFFGTCISALELIELGQSLETGNQEWNDSIALDLVNLYNNNESQLSALAKELMINFGNYEFLEKVHLPQIQASQRTVFNANDLPKTDANELLITYPNPIIRDYLAVKKAYGLTLTEGATYEIKDLNGKVLLEFSASQNEVDVLHLNTLEKGSYLLVLKDVGEVIKTIKLVKP